MGDFHNKIILFAEFRKLIFAKSILQAVLGFSFSGDISG